MHLLMSKKDTSPGPMMRPQTAEALAVLIPRTGRCPGCGLKGCALKAESPGYTMAELRPGGRRRLADTVGTEWLALDIDRPDLPAELAPYERVEIRTHSGNWHVLVRLERRATPGEYSATARPWVALGADAKALDACRFLFAPHRDSPVRALVGVALAVREAEAKPALERARAAPAVPARPLPWRLADLRAAIETQPDNTNAKAGALGRALLQCGWPRADAEQLIASFAWGDARHAASAMRAYEGSGPDNWNGIKALTKAGVPLQGSDVERAWPCVLRFNPDDAARPWWLYENGVWRHKAPAEVYAPLIAQMPDLQAETKPSRQVGLRTALLRQHEQHTLLETALDPDPYVLCVPNGIVDLRSGALLPHDPARLCSRMAGVPYDHTLDTASVEQLIVEWCEDADTAAELWLLAGYTLTGLASERCLPWLLGPKGTAKSSCLDLLAHVMGDYAVKVPSATWVEGKREPVDSIRRTRGARMCWSSEVPARAWQLDLIKEFTGGEATLSGEAKYKSQITWKQSCKLWLASNAEPTGADAALASRIRAVPFERQYQDDARFKAELPKRFADAFLVRAVAAAGSYLANGLPKRSARVQETTQNATIDPFVEALGVWLETKASGKSVSEVGGRELYQAFVREVEGTVSEQAFGRYMREFAKQYPGRRTEKGKRYSGLAL